MASTNASPVRKRFVPALLFWLAFRLERFDSFGLVIFFLLAMMVGPVKYTEDVHRLHSSIRIAANKADSWICIARSVSHRLRSPTYLRQCSL